MGCEGRGVLLIPALGRQNQETLCDGGKSELCGRESRASLVWSTSNTELKWLRNMDTLDSTSVSISRVSYTICIFIVGHELHSCNDSCRVGSFNTLEWNVSWRHSGIWKSAGSMWCHWTNESEEDIPVAETSKSISFFLVCRFIVFSSYFLHE